MIKVLFFAKSRDLVGCSETSIDLDDSNGLDGNKLLDLIVLKYPRLKVIKSTMILAVNETYIDMDATIQLRSDDVVALIPPLSGG